MLLLALLFALSQLLRIFDLKGGIAAAFVGGVIVFSADIEWLLLILIFAIASFGATKAFMDRKRKMSVQEGHNGERGYSNVVFGGVVGVLIAILSGLSFDGFAPKFQYFEVFAVSFAVITSDTFASEIGIIDNRVRLITDFTPVKPGVNGGISLTGTAAAVFGAAIIGISYSLLALGQIQLFPILFITGFGFAGNIIDSILGATMENKGILSKGSVNLLSALSATLIAVFVIASMSG